MKFKTGFSKLNAATRGGLDSGGVWGIVGRANTFKTGLAFTLLWGITSLNKPDTELGFGHALVLRCDDTPTDLTLTLLRVATGARSDFIHDLRVANWEIHLPSNDVISRSEEIEKAIESIEQLTGEKVRIIVFDHLMNTFVDDSFTPLQHKSATAELSRICKERNILALVPISTAKIPKGIQDFAGMILVHATHAVDGTLDTLDMDVFDSPSNKWTEFSVPFKKDPAYGLVSDITS